MDNNLHVRKNIHHITVTLLVTSLVTVLVIFVSIAYAALNASLTISGDLEYKAGEELYSIIAKSSKGLDTNIDFSVVPTEATSGVYKLNSTNSDKYPVYYYRGIVSNNNVKFAGFCWKMVRTTDTGGIKIIYNGTPRNNSCNNTGTASQIGTSAFNSSYNDAKYVGYTYAHTYDTNTNSTIKTYIDDWYSKNMLSYTNMLEDTIWCNDRSVSSASGGVIYYRAHGRLASSPYKPSIECTQASDKYTVSSSKGNGLLTYPVALLTADEATLAGHGWEKYSQSGYLRTGERWWTLSPSIFSVNNPVEFYVGSDGDLSRTRVNASYGVRPALSLKPGTMVNDGDGSYSNPYQIVGG